MENATKALLIAAAVLIAIVLIALGVSLLNSGSDITGQAESVSTSTAVQSFNAQFTGYLGRKKNASAIRNLIIAINASNESNADEVDYDKDITIEDGSYYDVTATYGGDGGRIDYITIVER